MTAIVIENYVDLINPRKMVLENLHFTYGLLINGNFSLWKVIFIINFKITRYIVLSTKCQKTVTQRKAANPGKSVKCLMIYL